MDRVEKVVECIKRYNPEKIIIFGSYVRGEMDEYSDLDFVVIKKTKKRFIRRLIEVAELIDLDLGKVDVLNLLRIQRERINENLLPSIAEYREYFGVTKKKLLKYARPGLLILHPGPVNRGVELTPDVLDKGVLEVTFSRTVDDASLDSAGKRHPSMAFVSSDNGQTWQEAKKALSSRNSCRLQNGGMIHLEKPTEVDMAKEE